MNKSLNRKIILHLDITTNAISENSIV